jgi:hypothetical protein
VELEGPSAAPASAPDPPLESLPAGIGVRLVSAGGAPHCRMRGASKLELTAVSNSSGLAGSHRAKQCKPELIDVGYLDQDEPHRRL